MLDIHANMQVIAVEVTYIAIKELVLTILLLLLLLA
jgi:hypothetical protein